MFSLTISCLTTSNFPWFRDLTFQVPKQYCSLQHEIFLLSPNTLTTKCCICLGPATSFIRGLFVILLHSSPVAYWTPSDLGDSSFGVIPFWPFIEFMRFSQQVYWGGLPILLQWITFCQNSLLWPSLGWPCMAWLIASLNYTSPFVTARQWSLKGTKTKSPACHQITKRSRTKISTLTVCFLCILHIISLFAFYIFLYYLGQLKYLFSWINVLLWYRKFHIALNIYFLSHIYPLIFE